MSAMAKFNLLGRIAIATPESPIAVFGPGPIFDVMFANTVKTRERIRTDPEFIGTFDQTMPGERVRQALEGLA